MSSQYHNCLILFVKYPFHGQVKTRLANSLGQITAARIYKHLVTGLLAGLETAPVNLKIFFTPADTEHKFRKWLGNNYSYAEQAGEHLGERMKNAFARVFKESFKNAVLIGSDVPDLRADLINRAFTALNKHDVVIGPSVDGGYYLIGFGADTFVPQAFEGITWGSNKVLEQTFAVLNQHKVNTALLPHLRDVDTLEDLQTFLLRNRNTSF